jgi:uncharacterized protein (TIGR02145 family)
MNKLIVKIKIIQSMKTKFFLTVTVLLLIINALGQKSTLELTFTAIDSAAYIRLDSIKVMNRTQGGVTILCWPDTTLVLDYQVGISEINQNNRTFRVFQNYPNPVIEHTSISLQIPEKDKVNIIVTDIFGRIILKYNRILNKGKHSFRFFPANRKLYFFTAQYKGKSSSIKILQASTHPNGECSLEYTGSEDVSSYLKGTEDIQSFLFNLGDELLYIGNTDTLQSGILNSPGESQAFTFQFATNIPCPGTPTVTYEGQVYNTIQIFSQCWLKENLNVGTMIPGYQGMEDNDTIEKYCYGNSPANCDNYGGLYIWDEMMQYNTQQGIQGICPPNWHIPTDEEWKILEGAVDSLYGIGNQIWNLYGLRGYDAGKNLKTISGWNSNGNGTDLFGFSGMSGGYLYSNGYFYYKGQHGLWWTSTEGNISSAWNRYLSYNNPEVDRDYGNNKVFSFSVRCIRNN